MRFVNANSCLNWFWISYWITVKRASLGPQLIFKRRKHRQCFNVHEKRKCVSRDIVGRDRLSGRVAKVWITLRLQQRSRKAAIWLSNRYDRRPDFVVCSTKCECLWQNHFDSCMAKKVENGLFIR